MNNFPISHKRAHEPPMPEALAYFLTWTTYGTWLPGDERGWVQKSNGFQVPDPTLKSSVQSRLTEAPCFLSSEQRQLVEQTIHAHCLYRGWSLHAVTCRTNHVHVVVTAMEHAPKVVRDQFKAWGTRRLKEHARERGATPRTKWWTEGGSQRFIGDEESLEAVIWYVTEGQ